MPTLENINKQPDWYTGYEHVQLVWFIWTHAMSQCTKYKIDLTFDY